MLQSEKSDPRVIRTRNLIKDAFLSLVNEKDFEAITVKDITDKATVNRATFYAHFEDKYALLDSLVSDIFMKSVSDRIEPETYLTEDTLRNLILIICDYHESKNNHCKRRFESVAALIDAKIQFKLQNIVMDLLTNNPTYAKVEAKKLEIVSIMISNSIYGATNRRYDESKVKDASTLVNEILPFVMAGVRGALGNL
jgi:AcrR family transcriptional regulator